MDMLDIVVLKNCEKEIAEFPDEIKIDFLDAVARLRLGENLTMPLVRPMPNIYKGLFELRLKSKEGAFRVFYLIKKRDSIYVLHAFQKKTEQTPYRTIELVKKRIGSVHLT
jgi:phage-related protein